MTRKTVFASILLPALAGIVLAQAPPQTPKPGPEHKKLRYFTGTWNSEYEMKQSPMAPAGKGSGVNRG